MTSFYRFGYVYIDLKGTDPKNVMQPTKIGGVSCDVKKAKPKSCFKTDMVNKFMFVNCNYFRNCIILCFFFHSLRLTMFLALLQVGKDIPMEQV